jgi:hypothetical protein|tara:strand:+ start:157 stop:369 length:213 start_codon:yes stop_codon:yes gene_type:complete
MCVFVCPPPGTKKNREEEKKQKTKSSVLGQHDTLTKKHFLHALKSSTHGTKRASRAWNETLSEAFDAYHG